MKFMVSWKIAPTHHQSAGEAFLKSGAPLPEGLTLVGRWHAPASTRGWALIEGEVLGALAEHLGRWASLLESEVSPVLEDDEAAQALARVYGL